jgi:outer membrane protein TolC
VQPYQPSPNNPLPPIPPVPPVPTIGAGQGLTLDQAVQLALQNNYAVQQSALTVVLDRASVAQAQAQLLPTVTFHGSYTSATPTQPVTIVPTINGVPTSITLPASNPPATLFSLNLQYPLYSGNALQDQVTISEANLASAQAAFTAEAATIVLQTRQAYYNVQAAAAQVTSSQGVVTASQENVRVTQAQVNVGTAPQFNLLQAQSQLATAQQNLTSAKAALVNAQYALNTLINVPLSTIIAPTTPFGLPQPPPDLDALIKTGLSERAELQEGEAVIRSFIAAIDLAKSGLRPTITINGGPQIQTNDPTVRDTVNWSGVFLLSLTVFDGGLTAAKVQSAEVQLQEARVSLATTQQTVESQVRTSYLNLQQAADSLRAAESGLTSAREQLRIAQVRLQAGVGTELDVTNALQTLATSETSAIQAFYSYNLALAQIDQATGTQVRF